MPDKKGFQNDSKTSTGMKEENFFISLIKEGKLKR